MTDSLNAVNPIDLEILWNRLISIADEAGAVLKRTSFSTVVNQLKPGDVLFTNDPWIGTGHLPDATMARPIFYRERLIGFAMAVAHLSDIGGRQWSADASELFEEGIRFPVLKLVEAGIPNELVMRLLLENVRLPQQVQGDMLAQLAALSVSEQRVLECLQEHNFESLDRIADAIFDASSRAALAELATLKHGVYVGEVDSDGFDESIHIQARVEVSDRGSLWHQ
ncbi:MAG: hypothetical protein EBS75_08375 [Betaproteobacteria bacterium]|nr:hypothetical protein [Betaproteobacteria bacterium]